MTRNEYIKKHKHSVLRYTRGTGLFPSVTMAQAILESSNSKGEPGESKLAKYFNNHFGVKAGGRYVGKKVNLNTTEFKNGEDGYVNDFFRIYSDSDTSFRDHTFVLKGNKAFQKAGVFTAPTPELQAYALQKGGYATDPNYAQKLIALMNELNLKSLDREAEKNAYAAAA